MFPGIDGFHWTIGHVVFLSLFFVVVLTIFATVVSAAWRTARDFRTNQAIELCWKLILSQNCRNLNAAAATNLRAE